MGSHAVGGDLDFVGAPILPFYRERGMLNQVDGMMSITEVSNKIKQIVTTV